MERKKEDSFVLRKKDHFYGGNGFITQEGGNRQKWSGKDPRKSAESGARNQKIRTLDVRSSGRQ